MSSAEELPRGTVTFLFTDIEGSTRLLKQLRERYAEVLSAHQEILRQAFEAHGGREIDTQGDSFFVAFARAKDAVAAAAEAQRALARHRWPDGVDVRVRMGVHTGEPTVGERRYVGLGVHRAARISAAGHGGQVLVSQTTRELLRDDPLPDVSFRDLGEHQLKDLDEPERIYQLVAPGLAAEFPPLKAAAAAPFEGREDVLVQAAEEAVARIRAPWRRRRLVGGAVGLGLAGIAALLAVLLAHGGTTGADASGVVAANAVGVLDARTGSVRTQIPVGEAPGGVAAGGGAIWVANADTGTVSRIDPQTNDVRQTIEVGGGPAGIAVGAGAVWVANGLDGTVSRIDTQTNQVTQTIQVGNGPSGVAYGSGAVWVANSADGTVSQIEPRTGHVVRTVAVAVGANGVAAGFGRIWVASPSSGSVVVLDARSGEVSDRVGVGVDATTLAAGDGAVWVANRADGTVSKIDPHAFAVTATTEVGRGPDGIAAGPDGVWVANGQDGTLSRIDPSSAAVVKTVRLSNPPQGLTVSDAGLYVAVRSSGQEHRGGTLRVVTEPPDSLDPTLAYSQVSWSILTITNDGLVAFRRVGGVEGAQLVPDLAVSLPTPTDGGKTYTFTLRPGIRYSTGRLVQPGDIKAELERVFEIAKPVTSPGRAIYGDIVGTSSCRPGSSCDLSRGIVTDESARSITFHLTEPDPDFLAKLALPFAVAVPAGTPAREVDHALPATGSYRLAAYEPGKLLRVVRRHDFRVWSVDARPEGYPDAIEWQFRGDPADVESAVKAVEQGKIDVAPSLVPPLSKQALAGLALTHPGQLHISTGSGTWYFFLNTHVAPFDDVRVRRAVNWAFDRSAFSQLLGRAFSPTCQILPPNFPGYRRSCPYSPGGLEALGKARALVRRSGTAGTKVTVWVPAPIAIQGRYMASVLDSLGYRARVHRVSATHGLGSYFGSVLDSRVRAQIGYYGWAADYPSGLSFLREEFACAAYVPGSPAETADPSGFCDQEIDAQMTHAALVQATDPPAATLLWQRIEREILDQAPMVPTYNARIVDFVSKRVRNYRFNPQWLVLLDQLWVK